MIIKINTSSATDIKQHLWSVSELFTPALSTYVDIDKYAEKLFEKAQRIEVWYKGELAGLLAYYNNKDEKIAFITNVSVSCDIMGKGIASEMIKQMEACAIGEVSIIRLEVNDTNIRAKQFYIKNGFIYKCSTDHGSIIMEKNIEV